MKFLEYGQEQEKIVLLICPGDQDNPMWLEQLKQLSERFHVVVPLLDHIREEEAEQRACVQAITSYFIQKYGKEVYAVCSLGNTWYLTRRLFSEHQLHSCKWLIEKSNLVKPGSGVLSNLI